MNNTQTIGFRNLWADVTTKEETMSARGMELHPLVLSTVNNVAKLKDGRTFYWNAKRNLWTR